jgi:hypothetical protein
MSLVTNTMQRAVMDPTERDRILVADLAAERAWLHEPKMMRIGRLAAADKACLLRHKEKVCAAAMAPRFGKCEHALINPGRRTTIAGPGSGCLWHCDRVAW